MNKEIWKDIVGYEGLYQVSNLGKVKNIKNNTIKIPTLCKNGYLYVDLWKENKRIKKTIHRLVAEHFLKNNNNYTDINHIDGNKQNNILTNLEFCNRSYNLKEAYRLKLREPVKPMLNKKDILCPNSKKVNQYDLKHNFIKQWGSAMEVQRKLGINHTHISSCCLNKKNYKTACGYIWKYVEVVDNDN